MQDLIRTKSDEAAVEQGCYVDEKAALRVKHFLETFCIQSKGEWAGKPLKLLDWQWKELILPLYGWKRKDGKRRFKLAIVYCPKKAGKTTLLSGLSLYHLLSEPGAECYCIASDIQQARVLYNQSADMVELSPSLAKRLWVRRNISAIQDDKAKSVFRVLSSTPEGKSGFSASFLAYDELAEWNGAHARTIYDRLCNAGMARSEPVQIVISTAQYNREHIGFEKYKLALDIRDGNVIDVSTLPVIYSLPEDQDWTKPDNWWKVHPSIDVTVSRQHYYEEYERTKHSPLDEVRFRTFLLDQWVGTADQWIASHLWAQAKAEYTEESLHKEEAFIGIDMARRHDIASYCVVVKKGERYYLLPRFFIAEENAHNKEVKDHVPYLRWARLPNSNLYLTPGDVVDPRIMRQHIAQDFEDFDIIEARFDPYGMEESRQILEYDHGFPMVEVKQSLQTMSPPTAYFERLLLDDKIRHPDNPVLNWCLGNCSVREDKQSRIMVEKKLDTARVDGITAAIIGLSGWLAFDAGSTFMPELL